VSPARAAESMRKAYDCGGGRASGKSSTFPRITSEFVTGNLEAARTAYELWAQTYPRDEISAT
jgi:hypothetical protein